MGNCIRGLHYWEKDETINHPGAVRGSMNIEKQKQKAQKAADEFNSKYSVGTKMHLIDDFGQAHVIETYAKASVVSCQAVGWATSDEKHWGSYLLERFKPIL